eukprot:CAMPEP_0172442006 /NCGR_PEP_ID=MMETSP1065-20121228/2483_1 /TAXON_ID=265537 /ORGANISM="Amphiprora paludosa, Strain CCMP125" /LENGTH=743 /DNA_ID=CAMNT_0013191655 /DNA_START=272 /DNA_END=2503 /DNA_ORIENTATION=+
MMISSGIFLLSGLLVASLSPKQASAFTPCSTTAHIFHPSAYLTRGLAFKPLFSNPSDDEDEPLGEDAFMSLIDFETRCGRFERAEETWQQFIQQNPSSSTYLKYAKWAEREAKNIRLAQSVFESMSAALSPEEMKKPEVTSEYAAFQQRIAYVEQRRRQQFEIEQSFRLEEQFRKNQGQRNFVPNGGLSGYGGFNGTPGYNAPPGYNVPRGPQNPPGMSKFRAERRRINNEIYGQDEDELPFTRKKKYRMGPPFGPPKRWQPDPEEVEEEEGNFTIEPMGPVFGEKSYQPPNSNNPRPVMGPDFDDYGPGSSSGGLGLGFGAPMGEMGGYPGVSPMGGYPGVSPMGGYGGGFGAGMGGGPLGMGGFGMGAPSPPMGGFPTPPMGEVPNGTNGDASSSASQSPTGGVTPDDATGSTPSESGSAPGVGEIPNGSVADGAGSMPMGGMPNGMSGMPNGMGGMPMGGMPNGMGGMPMGGMPNGMSGMPMGGMPYGMGGMPMGGMPYGMGGMPMGGMPNGMGGYPGDMTGQGFDSPEDPNWSTESFGAESSYTANYKPFDGRDFSYSQPFVGPRPVEPSEQTPGSTEETSNYQNDGSSTLGANGGVSPPSDQASPPSGREGQTGAEPGDFSAWRGSASFEPVQGPPAPRPGKANDKSSADKPKPRTSANSNIDEEEKADRNSKHDDIDDKLGSKKDTLNSEILAMKEALEKAQSNLEEVNQELESKDQPEDEEPDEPKPLSSDPGDFQ